MDDWNPPSPWKAVVKPLDSAGSDDVFLVETREEAVRCFEIIDGKVRVDCPFAALAQRPLKGG